MTKKQKDIIEELKKQVAKELKYNTREVIKSIFVRNEILLYTGGIVNIKNKSEVASRITGLLSQKGEKFLNELVENIYKVYVGND